MFGSAFSPAQAYNRVAVDTGVMSATPHRLIALLYEGAEKQLLAVDAALANGDLAAKGEAITRAIRIVDEGLKAALDPRAGELTENLGALYDYILRRLLDVSVSNDRAVVAEVRTLLHELGSAWTAIESDPSAGGARA
ncbi:MAG: flagellar export chaperone FliS [Burkholderiaceae bacterium]